MSSVIEISSNTVVVVVVDTDNPSLNNGPLNGWVVGGVLKTGIVVFVVFSSIQFVNFLNLPTLLLEPKISFVVILALYFAPSGTPEIVVIDIDAPPGIMYVLSVTFLLFTKTLTVNWAATLDFLLFIDMP